jgi:hypothetical protein
MGSRRSFFEKFSLLFGGTFLAGPTRALFPNTFTDQQMQKEIAAARVASLVEGNISETYDLVVVGGGISGVSAAISAARNGLKVALVHNRAMFGGNSSSEVKLFPENNAGHEPWIKEGGIHEEFHTEERVRNHEYYREGTMNCHWDLVLYEWVIREKNITSYLNTHMHRVFMKNDNRIESVFAIQLGTEKSFVLSAPLFVDASGDGLLGELAKAKYTWGREAQKEYNESLAPKVADEKVMGNTLFFTAKDAGMPVPFKRPDWAAEFPKESDLTSRGHSYFKGGYWWIEVGTPYHPIKDNNETRHEALRQLLGVWDHIKNRDCSTVPKEKSSSYGLDFVGFWPYKRASRRIIGDYVLTQHDIQNPHQLDDAVAYGCWQIDIHVDGGVLERDKQPFPAAHMENWQDIGTRVYGIPIRSLYSKNVGNLMMAGRPISCSYLAFASTRVLSTGSICGQAVGVVAALAKKYKKSPKEIARSHAPEAQQIILRSDGHIPGIENTDPNDIARNAKVTGTSHSKLSFPSPNSEHELIIAHAQLFPMSGDFIDKVELMLRSDKNTPAKIRLGLREAPHVWDFRSGNDLTVVEATVPANTQGWVSFNLKAQVKPGKLYYVYTVGKYPGIFWKAFHETEPAPNQVPIGTTAAVLPDKTNFSEKGATFKEIFSPVELKDIPGAGTEGHWKPLTEGKSLCIRLTPDSLPYQPVNIIKGTNRPDMWSNIWVSDPRQALPASIVLEWKSQVVFNKVQLTFDTDQNRRMILPLFRYPDCVKDYVIEYHNGTSWKKILSQEDNYIRRREHQFDTVKTNKLRITVLATNGAGTARIYEVRVYNEKI